MNDSHPLAPLLIASAPNGAYKTRREHDALPMSAAQLADTAEEVMRAGAQMIHLHVRDQRGRHTLDADAYRAAVAALRARVGEDLFIQLTSESAGVYTAEQQRQAIGAILGVGADGISIALRELLRSPADTAPARHLFHRLSACRMLIQYILFSHDDIARYALLRAQGVIPAGGHCVLLVVGRYDARPAVPDDLRSMVEALDTATNGSVCWMACAFGEHEFECLTEAVKLGGHVRVGFENSLLLKSGQPARDNRQLVTQLLESGNPDGRPLADHRQASGILGADASC